MIFWPFRTRNVRSHAGADPGFQVRGGAPLKKLRRAEEGANILGVFRVKNHYFTPKKSVFTITEGGAKNCGKYKGVSMIRVDFGPISETVYIDIISNTIIER
jgi:hypothetical protein